MTDGVEQDIDNEVDDPNADEAPKQETDSSYNPFDEEEDVGEDR